jgi:1,4-dihydroxy-2-naphthoyl-CoA hydrolase
MVNLEELNTWGKDCLPGWIGFEVIGAEPGELRTRMLHAAMVVALADTACGFGTRLDLPVEAKGFTTIELKTNYLGTATEGVLLCTATRPHRGRTTQVWDATVSHEQTGRTLALFRATQIILYSA